MVMVAQIWGSWVKVFVGEGSIRMRDFIEVLGKFWLWFLVGGRWGQAIHLLRSQVGRDQGYYLPVCFEDGTAVGVTDQDEGTGASVQLWRHEKGMEFFC